MLTHLTEPMDIKPSTAVGKGQLGGPDLCKIIKWAWIKSSMEKTNPSKGPQTGVESGRRRRRGGGGRGDRRENFGFFSFFHRFL